MDKCPTCGSDNLTVGTDHRHYNLCLDCGAEYDPEYYNDFHLNAGSEIDAAIDEMVFSWYLTDLAASYA